MSGSAVRWSASSSCSVNSVCRVVIGSPRVRRFLQFECILLSIPRQVVVSGGAPRQLLGREERQASILRGAAQAFARAGFAGTSMDDVAAAAGITKLIVYRHFDSKDELYRAVLQRVSSRLAEELVAALEQPQPRAIGARVLLTVAREDPDGFVLLWRHAAREPQFAAYAAEF